MARTRPPLWLRAPSRWAGLSRRRARLGLVVVAVLVVAAWSALLSSGPVVANGGRDDAAWSIGVVEGVRHGGNYYRVVADSLREDGLPLRPLVAFPLPTLAEVEAAMPRWTALALLWMLALGILVVWAIRLAPAFAKGLPRLVALALLAGGLVAVASPGSVAVQAAWAGLLMALSLALRRPGRWVEAAAVGTMAVLVRETAALYVAIMALLAWREQARREAAGWIAALGVLAVALILHAHAVAEVVRPLDPAAPRWGAMPGLGFVVRAAVESTVLGLLPLVVAAPLVALALVGWASWRSPLGRRTVVTLAGYAVLLSLAGSGNPFYEGAMIAPLLLVGLAFVPDGLRDLRAAARDRRRLTVRRRVA